MERRIENILDIMENSGDSQSLAVAECLRNIADNGDEQAKSSYLVGCAKEIIKSAQYFIYYASQEKIVLDIRRRGV